MKEINSFKDENRWLSNFFPVIVELDGDFYPSVEHAYQAAKTLDFETRKLFQDSKLTAGQAKRLSRKIQIRPEWEEIKLGVMDDLLRQKFDSGFLKNKLLSTKGIKLVEGNTWGDTFWGVCNGVGKNHLGKLLMQIRDELD